MKRLLLFIALSIAFCALSCTSIEQDIENIPTPDSSANIPQTLSAFIDSEDSRTTSEQIDGAVQMYWHADDKIAVTDRNIAIEYKLKSGVGEVGAEFQPADQAETKGFEEGATLYGISPYSAVVFKNLHLKPQLPDLNPEEGEEWAPYTRSQQSKISVDIPTSQLYTESGRYGENEGARNIMFGAGDGRSIRFRPIVALARFSIVLADDAEIIYSVRMRTEKSPISGLSEIDWLSGEIISSTSNHVTLNYAAPAQGTTSTGWAAIAPIDWSATEEKVYYDIYTNKGQYTFCKRPTKAFEPGRVYNFPLSQAAFSPAEFPEKLTDGQYTFTESVLKVAAVRQTDSTITIGWSVTSSNINLAAPTPYENNDFTADLLKTYRLALYNTPDAAEPVISIENIVGREYYSSALPPRFTFCGLEPATTYYVKVWNTTDTQQSEMLCITTTPSVATRNDVVNDDAKAGDLILFENFASLRYSGDLSAYASGLRYNSQSSSTKEIIIGDNGEALLTGDSAQAIFGSNSLPLSDIGLKKWGWIGKEDSANDSFAACGGYIKVSTHGTDSFICTPALSAIPQGKSAKVRILFNAAPINEKAVCIKTLHGATLSSDNKVSYIAEGDSSTLSINETDDKTCWREYEAMLEDVLCDDVIAIGGGVGSAEDSSLQIDDLRIYVEEISDSNLIFGRIDYSDGTPAEGVSVSDGFSVVATNANGEYTLSPHQDTWYIYYSIPSDSKIETANGHPNFYTRYDKSISAYNFSLTKQAVESDFTLFCLADPQCRNDKEIGYFSTETVPAIKAHAKGKSTPCYGVTLGDIVHTKSGQQCSQYMDDMYDWMKSDKIGIPVFQTMGNHDYTDLSDKKYVDETKYPGSSYNLRMQRLFEDIFGPVNYSWNRGSTHIVCMRNIIYDENNDVTKGFTDEQYQWLVEDLAHVSQDKFVILCVHIPLIQGNITDYNVDKVIELLKQYPKRLVLSGHTHYMRHRMRLNIDEHTFAAVCGAWWSGKINNDGSPNGYGVYEISDNSVKEEYYMSVNEGKNDKSFQMRLYRGNLKCGDTGILSKYYELQHGEDTILAAVFNAIAPQNNEGKTPWSVKIYEDDKAYDMEFINEKKYGLDDTNHIDMPSYFSPVKVPTDSSQDWWAIGYRACIIGATDAHTQCFHMYKHKLQNPSASSIRVVATDPYGNTYESSHIIKNGDDIYADIRR